MVKSRRSFDKVRASRDGHEFHEAWTARRALQLLLPFDNLIGIAVEGLSPADQSKAESETVEIADIVLYYGRRATFNGANIVNIVQFKYSVSDSDVGFRNSHAKKTIGKFAIAYLDHMQTYGEKDVQKKLQFELITNRPIYPAFEKAISSLAGKKPLTGEVRKQADQFKAACGFDGEDLVEFASKCRVTGLAGSLSENKSGLSRTLVDWSATADDSMARARLGAMKDLVRRKAGSDGESKNIIGLIDVLDALEVQDVNDLLPCPASFPDIGEMVERTQLPEAIALVSKLDKPLLIHAAGGIGKTVFVESLAKSLSESHEIVLFDCFGGGAYRAPEDARHLPKRGLVHIANMLACSGLCDPLLPGSENLEELVKLFRRRLSQCVKTMRRTMPSKEVVLLLDAIDNAAEHANDRNEHSFPKVLLESLHYSGGIPGVRLIVTCRTERIPISKGDAECVEFPLEPFSLAETKRYLSSCLKKVSQTEVRVAQARSGGNARILEHLVTSDRGLLDVSEIDNPITLDELLTDRIRKALSAASARGYKKPQIDAFLAGLAVLPPPVPLEEYAGAHGLDVSAIESFAADLAPLLERTRHGLMFRDEPTEILIRRDYASNLGVLRRLAKNLLARQDDSVYAASSLPGLLQKLDDGEGLFKLAFDERFPHSITSTVGKRNIRYARLKAAVLYAAHKQDNNQLIHLLVELSTIAAVDRRGAEYILENPDLVITANDVDATRRLFEIRTNWPGTRHARLVIANTLSGDSDDAYRHAIRADEWIFHYRQREQEQGVDREGPDRLDIAAIPFCLISQKSSKDAVIYMRGWKDWYGYEVSEYLFSLLEQATPAVTQSNDSLNAFLGSLTDEIGVIAAALSFVEIGSSNREELIRKLAKACVKSKAIESDSRFHRERRYVLQDGLLKASVIALSMGLRSEALQISSFTLNDRPGIWSFRDHYSDQYVFPFLAHTALISVVKGQDLHEQDILPKELVNICSSLGNSGLEFREKIRNDLEEYFQKGRKLAKDEDKIFSYKEKQDAEGYINERLEPLFALTKAFANLIGAPINKADKEFLGLIAVWRETRKKRDHYNAVYKYDPFFQLLGSQIAVFTLWTRSDLDVASVEKYLECLHGQEMLGAHVLIDVVAILARRSPLHTLAGEQAVKARLLIEREDEVTSRASLFSQLGRAIAPASSIEAAEYFREGLEQMDAIGSGDYQFTNELLLFASSLKGDELDDKESHTLTNICELNMSDEEEKFPWYAYATGMSKISGCKGLAKLARWDDRSRVSLDYTLLPYLTALIEDNKIAPEDALALLRLSNPVELHSCNTAAFAKAIDKNDYPNKEQLVGELIYQFESNNHSIPMDSTVKTLASLAEKALGNESETTVYLSTAHEHFGRIRDENNENDNYRGKSEERISHSVEGGANENQRKLKELVARTIPNSDASIASAVDALNEMRNIYDLKGKFFASLRGEVAFPDRHQYIEIVAHLENMDIYTKLAELEECKKEWGQSSAALTGIYEALAIPLIQLHTEDLLSYEQLSVYHLVKITELSGVPIELLAVELTRIFASPERNIPASVWLGLASIISDNSDNGEGQSAMARLLNSNAAKLASNVTDGEWTDGLYPSNDRVEIASGFVWRMLGSPHAVDRWRAAHSIRCFARYQRWDVIDALVAKMDREDALPFQASELPFYFLHARLWLLIALARIAIDEPAKVAKYTDVMKKTVADEIIPHVLMRYFAAVTLLTCAKNGSTKLSAKESKQIKGINVSPLPRLNKKPKNGGYDYYYGDRPKDIPRPEPEFHLDYDFGKYDVKCVSAVFGKPGWEVKDMITETVRGYDNEITSMFDSGGREESRRYRMGHMSALHHSYGQQLGWHALFIVAGHLLSKYPVTDDSFEEDPWAACLNRKLLTREDGLWLSDGMDRPPLDSRINLLEKGEEGLVLTGAKEKLLNLTGIGAVLGKEIVVNGRWNSPDNVDVHINSALVSPGRAGVLAKELAQEDPLLAWTPAYGKYEDEEEYLNAEKKDYIPWIVCPSSEANLDEYDPLGAACAMQRPYFANNITTTFSLDTADPFGRIWKNSAGKSLAYSRAWGYESRHEYEASTSGVRLECSGELLEKVLTTLDADLLVLINLQRYEKGTGNKDGSHSNTMAVVRIKKSLDFEFFIGAVDKVHKHSY